jgi:hypothetical protein
MRFGGYLIVLRAALAALLRAIQRGPLWLTEAVGVAADCADPEMPESIWRPREWLPRLWSRGQHTDLHPPPGA